MIVSNHRTESYKAILLPATSNALKLSQKTTNFYESFIDIRKSCKRATPNQMITYKQTILKLYNNNLPQADWIEPYTQQIFTSHHTTFKIIKINNYLVGNNNL